MKCHFCEKTRLWMIKTLLQNGYRNGIPEDITDCWTCIECFKNELMKDKSYEF